MPTPGPLELIVVLVFTLVLVVLLARFVHSFLPHESRRDPALDALRTRLAKGEIDEAEFQRLRSVLQSQ